MGDTCFLLLTLFNSNYEIGSSNPHPVLFLTGDVLSEDPEGLLIFWYDSIESLFLSFS